jgi:hypothetical protein
MMVDGSLEATPTERIASVGMRMTILDGEVAWSADQLEAP